MKIFERVKRMKVRKSGFDLSHDRKQSMKMGRIYPSFVQEVMPGDVMSNKMEHITRIAPLIAPIMHRVNVTTHYFFVPWRIIWTEWEDFITGGRDGLQAPQVPTIQLLSRGYEHGRLADYLGLPTRDKDLGAPDVPLEVSALPFRAYHTIYNEYYRDQNVMEEFDILAEEDPGGGTPTTAYLTTQEKLWNRDYFTSALPTAQRGPAVDLPVNWEPAYKQITEVYKPDGTEFPQGTNLQTGGPANLNEVEGQGEDRARFENLQEEQDGITVNIEELRRASRLQEFLELMMQGGARIHEMTKTMFGVDMGDARVQRPEYLGGGMSPLVISEVLNTTGQVDTDAGPTAATLPQGNMAGHGISVDSNASFKYRCKEFGIILGLTSITPKTAYQQGIPKMFKRFDRFDYPFPKFANLGEQAIKNWELYHGFEQGDMNENNQDFGYQQRYAEWKYATCTVHGSFRDTTDFWHLGRKFDSRPALTPNFLRARADVDRILAVLAEDQDGSDTDYFFSHIYNNCKVRRPLPFFSNPQL